MGVQVRDDHGRGPPDWPGTFSVLVSFTPAYAAYGEALLRGLRDSRPDLRVDFGPLPRAAEAAARLRPHLIISDGAVAAPGTAKVKLSAEPTEPSTMRLKGVVRTVVNPTFDDLLAFVHEVERARNDEPWPARNEEEGCSRG